MITITLRASAFKARKHRGHVHCCTRIRRTVQRAMVQFTGLASPDDLLILLSVARLGRFTTVADALGTTHTTISRRIAALDTQLGDRTLARTQHGWELTALGVQAVRAAEAIEKSLGTLAADARQDSDPLSGLLRISTVDGFGAEFVAPALIRLQADHPQLRVELLSATRRISQNRSGVDLEIVIGRPEVHNAQAIFLTDYCLRLYASAEYLGREGTPGTIAAVQNHTVISYVESALLVTELGLASAQLPEPATSFHATSIFAQLQAVRHHGGIGLLPIPDSSTCCQAPSSAASRSGWWRDRNHCARRHSRPR
jgi:DNA-binding transcriptional LysR family regulator